MTSNRLHARSKYACLQYQYQYQYKRPYRAARTPMTTEVGGEAHKHSAFEGRGEPDDGKNVL